MEIDDRLQLTDHKRANFNKDLGSPCVNCKDEQQYLKSPEQTVWDTSLEKSLFVLQVIHAEKLWFMENQFLFAATSWLTSLVCREVAESVLPDHQTWPVVQQTADDPRGVALAWHVKAEILHVWVLATEKQKCFGSFSGPSSKLGQQNNISYETEMKPPSKQDMLEKKRQ